MNSLLTSFEDIEDPRIDRTKKNPIKERRKARVFRLLGVYLLHRKITGKEEADT